VCNNVTLFAITLLLSAASWQVYLGGYATELDAAHAYDRAAIAYWGQTAKTNVSHTWRRESRQLSRAYLVGGLNR
jgi:hypothetical protein